MRCSLQGLLAALLLIGCASQPVQSSSSSKAQSLLGKTQEQIIQCAGKPLNQTSWPNAVVLRYYKEAPMLEESRPFLKGSQPSMHHGCWAGLIIENETVAGVEFRTVPEGAEKEDDECEEIFRQCGL